ncbi:hypothetical protein LINPERHAP1_LOCUS19289 [Linum perenne]
MGSHYLLCHIKYFYYPKLHYITYLFHFHSSFNRFHKKKPHPILSQIFSAFSRRTRRFNLYIQRTTTGRHSTADSSVLVLCFRFDFWCVV